MTYESHLEELPEDAPWNEKPGESTVEQHDTDAIPEVDVTEDDLLQSGETAENWLIFGNNYENNRHATADVVTPGNVHRLEREWEIEIGDEPNDFQGPPIVVHGDPPIMYQTIGPDMLYAINARTGDVLWTHFYEPAVGASEETPPAERGVGVLGDTVYKSTLDLGVLAIDRYTGEERWYYNGAASYRGEVAEDLMHDELEWERSRGTTSSWPPLIYDGKLMKGSFGGEFGVSGFFDAIDLEGNPQWRINMTPPHEWVGDSWMHGGATAWAAGAIEPERGSVVVPAANPGPWYGTVRPGYNPYSAGKVGADIETGEYEWHFQDAPHDWWDYDSSSPPMVIDADVDGESRTFATWAGKTGWVYTVDMETGQLHERSEEVVQHLNMWNLPPFENIEDAPWIMPELTGGTNPQPSAYDPNTRTLVVKATNRPMKFSWFEVEYEPGESYVGMDSLRARTEAEQEMEEQEAEEEDEEEEEEEEEAPKKRKEREKDDGKEKDAEAKGDEEEAPEKRKEREKDDGKEKDAEAKEEEEEEDDGEDVAIDVAPPPEWNRRGGVIAGLDPISGDVKWKDWFDPTAGRPWGGSMTTATGLTFAGTPLGELAVYRTETGELLESLDVGNHGVDGDPVSWYDPQEGKQYVAIPGGGGWESRAGEGNTLAVFSLSE